MLPALTLAAILLGPGVPPGTPIVAIRVMRHDVFDLAQPGTSSWPYRTANALHVLSREAFIRSLLLFKEGDRLDPAILAESERVLRATGFLSPVDITAHVVPGGAEVVVETRDQWTTEFSLNYGLAGSRQKGGVSLTEKNFLGWGKGLDLEWKTDPERSSVTLSYDDPLLLSTRWRLATSYSEASDGTTKYFALSYPFFALDTPLAGGVELRKERLREFLWAAGKKAVEGDASRQELRLWGGLRLPGGRAITNRLILGLFSDEAVFGQWQHTDGEPYAAPGDRDLAGLELTWDHQVDRWEVLRGFRAWERQEDVPLGPNWSATLGLSLPTFGGDRRRVLLGADLTLGALRGRQYSWLLANLSGRVEGTATRNVIAHLELGSARPGAVGWRARLAADVSHALDRDHQLTLGADTGLRGWDPDTFDGTSRAVLNLEWRARLTGEVLHLGVIGATVFADAGRTWGARVGADSRGVRGDIGAGLAVEITRAAILRIVRVEVAFPDNGQGPLVLLTGASLF